MKAEFSPLRERLPDDLGCKQELEGIWENEEECLLAVLRQANECCWSGCVIRVWSIRSLSIT